MALSRLLPQAEMLVVTTPQLAAQKVAIRVADMARRSFMPILGAVENMSAFVCEHGERYAVFGRGGGNRLSEDLNIPLLGQIPLDPAVVEGQDNGRCKDQSPVCESYGLTKSPGGVKLVQKLYPALMK